MLPILGKSISFKDYTSAKVLVHWMPWFGTPGHIKLAYNSADVSTCELQCDIMEQMSISGVNVDYYGPESASALACLRMLAACERFNLSYSICIDQGALSGLTGAAATAEYIRILKFLEDAFFSSSSYLQDQNRYVVNFFGEPTGVNWTAIRAGVKSKLALIFQGGVGFTHAESDGGFGWVNPTTPAANINMPSLNTFISAAASNSTKLAMYPVYTGFDDSLAGWGKNRFMSRRGGQTLLDTLKLIPVNAKYALIATWNDHEEGTGIEYSQG